MRNTWRGRFRLFCELALFAAIVTTPLFAQSGTPTNPPSVETGSGRRASRVKLYIGASQQMTFDTPVQSVTIVDPRTAKATVIGERVVLLTGLDIGETIVIVSTQKQRETLIAQVIDHPVDVRPANGSAVRGKRHADRAAGTGSYTIGFTAPTSNSGAFLSHNLQYRQTLASGRTLEVDSSLFSSFGNNSDPLMIAGWTAVGVNRLSVVLRNKDSSLEFLDHEINVSPLTFSGYTIRGFQIKNL